MQWNPQDNNLLHSKPLHRHTAIFYPQLKNAKTEFDALKTELDQTKAALQTAQLQLVAKESTSTTMPKIKKPENFTGKESIISWTTHMSNYLQKIADPEAMSIAVSYLQDNAHEWWIKFKDTEEGRVISTWAQLKHGLISRFDTLNKEKVARDKLARWKQLKDVSSFNEDFQSIILDIPNISVDEQIDRYTRGLKNYIWKELCTKEYTRLADAMRDAERVESAHKRVTPPKGPKNNSGQGNSNPVPMELGNVQIKKLTKEEREKCMKEGLCLRCRQKGHMAKDCPKGKRN